MKNYTIYFKALLVLPFTFCILHSQAQRDTTKHQVINVISSYKPVIRNAVKINLSATPLEADTTKPFLTYSIPAMNLFFAYQPVELKPLALTIDTTLILGERNYVKVGFGNYSTPYLKAALSFGDGKKGIANVYANYISSKGNITNQNFAQFNVKALGSYFFKGNELYGGIGYSLNNYFQYGYDHGLNTFSKDSIRRKYGDLMFNAGVRNTKTNSSGINYSPEVEAHIFSRQDSATENNFILTLPAEKKLTSHLTVKMAIKGDFSTYTIKSPIANVKMNNNLFQLAPEVVYYGDKYTIHAGLTPSWDNKNLSLLPNIYGEVPLQGKKLNIQVGITGRFIKNSYRTLTALNPYMKDSVPILNTREIEIYGGVKAIIDKHLSFNAKAGFVTIRNMPLFVNDSIIGNAFYISNESKMNDLYIHGDMSYVKQEQYSITAALDIHNYSGLTDNLNAWHLVPVQLTGSFRWNLMKQLTVRSDLFFFSNVPVLVNKKETKLPSAVDLTIGGELKINKKLSAWLDFNNLFNKKYERWKNYPVYGFHAIGGVAFHF
jgi:hypothetical protein